MDEILYLEPDEEITSVVDKLKGLEADSVGLVAPKGSSIVQSLVSLKLLQKQAEELGKEISIVTSDEVGQNLAGRINLPVYADVRSKKPIEPVQQKEPEDTGPIEIEAAEEEAKAPNPAKEPKYQEKPATKTEPAKEEKQKPIPEEYKDLPKSFEVHRYDEKDLSAEEPVIEEETMSSEQSEKINEASEQSEPKFINRPLSERKREVNRIDLESARPTIAEKKQVDRSKKHSARKTVFIVVGVFLFLAALFLADLALAKLTIEMSIPADPIEKTVSVTAEKDHPNPDYEKGIIGGTQIDKEVPQEGNYPATGEKETGEQAKGKININNELGTDVSLSSGATIRSDSGVSFTLDAAVNVPKATLDAGGNKVVGKATGSITAKDAGAGSNMPSGTSYVVEGRTGLNLTGSTSGGTTKKVKIVTRADVESAKMDIAKKASDKFKQDLASNADTIFLEDAYTAETTTFTTSKNINDEADNFTASAKVRIVTLTFSKNQFKQAVTEVAQRDLPEGKSLLVTDSDEVIPTLEENQLNVGKLRLKGQLKSHLGPKIDLQKMISGFKLKPIKKIRSEVESIPGATVKQVNISPDYALPLGPLLKKNTRINIEYTNK